MDMERPRLICLTQKYLVKIPIVKYPDPDKPYTLFTDASKYVWVCVLMQTYDHIKEGKKGPSYTHHICKQFI